MKPEASLLHDLAPRLLAFGLRLIDPRTPVDVMQMVGLPVAPRGEELLGGKVAGGDVGVDVIAGDVGGPGWGCAADEGHDGDREGGEDRA